MRKTEGPWSRGNHKRRRRACEECGKVTDQEETTKEGGEGLTHSSTESSESVETVIQNFVFEPLSLSVVSYFESKFSLNNSYSFSCIYSSNLSSTA